MNPLTLPIITASILGLGVALPWSTAIAQTAKDLVGTWNAVSATVEQGGNKTDTFGPNPKGTLVFDGNGRYVLVYPNSRPTIARPEPQKKTRLSFRAA